jgi:hypothetical protein
VIVLAAAMKVVGASVGTPTAGHLAGDQSSLLPKMSTTS